jgi:hypothetical protein
LGPRTWTSWSCSGVILVAAAADAEAVDEAAAHRRPEVLADRLEVDPQLGDLLAIDLELRLRLVDLQVDQRGEGEHPARRRLLLELLREAEDLGGLRRGGEDHLDRERAAARERRREDREGLDARDLHELPLELREELEDRPLALAPRLHPHPPRTPGSGR